jgi:hypothetical protein
MAMGRQRDKGRTRAARFYAATVPNIEVTAVHKAPSDFPGGKKGDELDWFCIGRPRSKRPELRGERGDDRARRRNH